MTLTLGEFKSGERGRVIGFGESEKSYRTKLLTMGFIKGTEFTVARKAPLGDPVEIEIKGYNLSLRKDEAGAVLAEKI